MPKRKYGDVYMVNVTVLEGRHYRSANTDSFVQIKVGQGIRKTNIIKSSDCPYYNEYFVFEFVTDKQTLLDKTLTLTVIQPRAGCTCKKYLGYVTLDLATVWEQPDHQFFRKWAILSSLTSSTTGPSGYLKCTISILSKGETPKIPYVNRKADGDIEGNLLLPEGITLERKKAFYIFRIYRGCNIIKNDSEVTVIEDDGPGNDISNKHILPDVHMEVTFAGITGKTAVKKRTSFPVWNESLTISELFPPLSQSIKLELVYRYGIRKNYKSVKYLKMKSISYDGPNGYLPTFGPSFINFYSEHKWGVQFVGSVLISLETKVFADVRIETRCVIKDYIPTVIEDALWTKENVILFITILNVFGVDKRFSEKPISFEVCWGRTRLFKRVRDGLNIEEVPNFNTPAYHPITTDKLYWYINFINSVPCLHIVASHPNMRRRFYNANMISRILFELHKRLKSIEDLFVHDEFCTNSKQIEENLIALFDSLSASCRKYIDIVTTKGNHGVTDLDMHKQAHCIDEIRDIESICVHAYAPRTKKDSFRIAEKICRRLELLVDHPQECYPDVLLWLRYNNKRGSCSVIPARDLIYSLIDEERGIECGKVTTLYFTTTTPSRSLSPTVCKLEAYLWLGLDKDLNLCKMSLPKGYEWPDDLTDNIPRELAIKDKIAFSCRAHIYQGRFLMSFDYSGLSDFLTRVIICEQSRHTKARKASLNPMWDQTLIFQQVYVYGTREHIAENPPQILIEVLDQDTCMQLDFVGSCIMLPIIKFKHETYSAPKFPPRLAWSDVKNNDQLIGEILGVVEMLEISDDNPPIEEPKKHKTILPITLDIKPVLVSYRLEVFFWGVRNLKKLKCTHISKPRILIECCEYKICSETISNPKRFANFTEAIKLIDLNLPNVEEFIPPLTIKLFDCRCFGSCIYAGTNLAYIHHFIYHSVDRAEWNAKMRGRDLKSFDSMISAEEVRAKIGPKQKIPSYFTEIKEKPPKLKWYQCCKRLYKMCRCKRKEDTSSKKDIDLDKHESKIIEEEDDTKDWWTKYFASVPKTDDVIAEHLTTNINLKLKIYSSELEKQPEFEKFKDTIGRHQIYRGKTIGDEVADEYCAIGELRCNIKLYSWPPANTLEHVTPRGYDLSKGFFQGFPTNVAQDYILRVYCVRGIKLRPMDLSGKCDSYIVIKMGKQVIDDHKNRIIKNTDPIFGKCFELKGRFPTDHTITIAVWDWDQTCSNDLIGETKIDIESRLYTKHRACCGLAYQYTEKGSTPWRDQCKPTQILQDMCTQFNVASPEYTEDSIKVGCNVFEPPKSDGLLGEDAIINKENLALYALHRWNEVPVVGCFLVPEHVETRSLYNPNKLGIEQGKLQMWIDIFISNDLPPPDMVIIQPRKPVSYELRVVVLNTEDVILNEDDFFGGRKSDIYVKGWINLPTESQQTDVHYRSLTGEGNFNWRLVFHFDYLAAENMNVIRVKGTLMDAGDADVKFPCSLKMQVWDNDIFSKDDFLGTLTLDLNRFKRGAVSPKKCTLKILEPNAPTVNLFKTKRTKGWWPFSTLLTTGNNKSILTGKLEAEFELLTAEEAAINPAGLGRAPPLPLPPPMRPDNSFLWFKHPFNTCRYIIWKNMKYKLLKCCCFILVLAFIGLAIYSFPGYSVKRFLGA